MPNLKVVIQRAVDLVAADSNGKSDPFVRVYVGASKQDTKVIDNELNPIWNETFEFDCNIGSDFIALDVYDRDRLSKDDSIGSAVIPKVEVAGLQKGVERVFELKLTNVKHGVLYVALTLL